MCYRIFDEKGEPSVYMQSDLELEPERRAQNQRYSVGFLNVCQTPVFYSCVITQLLLPHLPT